MSHNILITGASGYLGGTILARWQSANLPAYANLYALVRSEQQAEAVQQYGAQPLMVELNDPERLSKAIIDHEITIVYFLIDALTARYQPVVIKALGEVRKRTGRDVHFLNTTGAKMFSGHVGVPTDRPLLDTDPGLYDALRGVNAPDEAWNEAARSNTVVIDVAEEHDVRTYIFVPCIVYGPGEGFGNRTSIQDVAIVKAALKAGQVYTLDKDDPTWPVCHIVDNTTLYLQILRKILAGEHDQLGYGRNGFYLAASGNIAWSALKQAIAKSLFKRGAIKTDEVALADEKAKVKMAEALGVRPDQVAIQVGGKCALTPANGRQIGWVPQYAPEHIVEDADNEVGFILEQLQK